MPFDRLKTVLKGVAMATSLAVVSAVGGLGSTPALADQSNPLIANTAGVTALNDSEMQKVQGSGTYSDYYGYYGYLYSYYAMQYAYAGYQYSGSSTEYSYYNAAASYAGSAYNYLRYAAAYAYYGY